ncbi:MAG TPA: HlyD family secretion protein [Steroidobacteraceae bacterium]|jgi:membrane fusion protein (multidrug efflux system)|nr:HlyD family secretion protein [Steroidobacteraceae bacterium]
MNTVAETFNHPVDSRWTDRLGAIGARRIAVYAAIAAAIVAAVGYGRYWESTGRYIENTDDAYVGGDITVIAPKVAGFIEQVAVTDNQAVKAGDLLVKLDDRDYQAAFVRAQAAADAQQATLDNLDATRRLQLAVIDQTRAGVTAANAELTRAHDDAARFKELSAHSAASIQVYQKAAADFEEAGAQVAKSHAAVAAAERELEVIDTRKRQTQAALLEAGANVELARLNLSYTELRSPISGVVGNRSARNGAYAAIGTQLIAVVPSQGLWIDANFKESQLTHMRPAQRVTVTADVLPGEHFTGHVESLAPATGAQFSVLPAENATGNFTKIVQRVPVRIVLDRDASSLGRLRPGLSVDVAVDERVVDQRAGK